MDKSIFIVISESCMGVPVTVLVRIPGPQCNLFCVFLAQCCQTKDRLNTADNNWEKGETNYFVGHQLQGDHDELYRN